MDVGMHSVYVEVRGHLRESSLCLTMSPGGPALAVGAAGGPVPSWGSFVFNSSLFEQEE